MAKRAIRRSKMEAVKQGTASCKGLSKKREVECLSDRLTGKQTEYSDGDSDSDYPSRVNPLQLVNALQAVKTSQKGLLYVRARINGVDVLAMMDSGATHNFVTDRVATHLKLKLVQNRSLIKAVNSEAKMISGMAKDVKIHVGDWKGKTSLFSVLLDDFDVILGLEFFLQAKVALVPHLGGLFIADEEQPCSVHAEWRYKGKTEKLSALGLYSSTSAESGVENSSVEAKGFTCTETVTFPKPKTGHGSFGAHASCCSPNPKNSERISHVEAGKKKSPQMKPMWFCPNQGVIATLSNEVREDDVKNEVVEDFKKLNLGENASNSGGTQADRNMETNSDNEMPTGESRNESMKMKRIASEFLVKYFSTQLVGNIYAEANQTGISSNTSQTSMSSYTNQRGISSDTNQTGITSTTNQTGISSDTVLIVFALAIITAVKLKNAKN